MAVQNLVTRIETWIANYNYSALRTAAHQTRHTSIRYSLDWMIDGVVQMINEASTNSVGVNPNIDQANLRTVIGAKWSTVITKRNFSRWVHQDGNLPTPTFYSLAAAEASSGQKANNAPSGTNAAIALELEGGDIVLTALNCYRYQPPASGTSPFPASSFSSVTNKAFYRLAHDTMKDANTEGFLTSTPTGRNLRVGSRSNRVEDRAYHEHHEPGSTVAEVSMADMLSNLQSQLRSGPQFRGRMPIAYNTVMDPLEARIKVWEKNASGIRNNANSFYVKEDLLEIKIGHPNRTGESANWDTPAFSTLLTAIQDMVLRYVGDPDFIGSKPAGKRLQELGTAVAIGQIVKGSKKNLKWTEDKKQTRPKAEKSKKKGAGQTLINRKKKGRKLKKYVGKRVVATKAMKSRVQGKAGVSPIALRTLLNTLLPRAVASKMVGGKTLAFRTGRFASSAEVTNVTQGSKGGMQIDYSYMKYPYQTFEPGFAQGSTFRDPRLLIGQSIRELATQIMQEKFTGRVRRI